MTTLALNGLGLTFAAPGEISYNYSKQSWGGYWLGTYFNMNWYGENLTYTAGATLPSKWNYHQYWINVPCYWRTLLLG